MPRRDETLTATRLRAAPRDPERLLLARTKARLEGLCKFSLLPEQKVHHPAATDVRPRTSAMAENLHLVAPGCFKGVRQFGLAIKGTQVVDSLR